MRGFSIIIYGIPEGILKRVHTKLPFEFSVFFRVCVIAWNLRRISKRKN